MTLRSWLLSLSVSLSLTGLSQMALNDELLPAPADERVVVATTSVASPLPVAVRQQMPNFYKQIARWQRASGKQATVRGWYANGQLAIEANVHQHTLHGSWQTWYATGQRRDAGHFKKGKPHGAWNGWYANGQQQWLRHFDAGKQQAAMIARQQRNPKLHFHPTAVQRGEVNFMTAATVMAMPSAVEVPFAECLAQGLAENYFDNGKLADAGYYVQGLKEGMWQQYNAYHQPVQSGYYLHGQRHGAWKYYQAGGKLKSMSEYSHGVLQHEKVFVR